MSRVSGTTKRLSRISADEMGALDAQLYLQFERFAEAAESDTVGARTITSSGFLRFVRETGLAEHAGISAGEASLAFSSVVLGSKKTLKFERFSEACRKLATAKSVTFQALVHLAAGHDPVLDTVSEAEAAGAPTVGGGFAASTAEAEAEADAKAAAARTAEAPAGFSAADASNLVEEGSVKALMAKAQNGFGTNKSKGKQVSAKVASRQRKFGGGATIFDGDIKGTSSANAKLMAMRTGSVKQRAGKFGGGGGVVDGASAAAKTINKGAVGARAARFGGPVAAAASGADAGGTDAMSAANAASVCSGVAGRRDLFGAKHSKGASADFSAAHARAAISKGSVASRASAFGGSSPAPEANAADAGSGFSPANARAEIAASRGGGVAARLANFDGATKADAQASQEMSQLNPKEAAAALRSRLMKFYQAHNPENIDKLETVVTKYVGDGSDLAKAQRKLDKQLKHKYGISLSDFEAAQAAKNEIAPLNPFSKSNYRPSGSAPEMGIAAAAATAGEATAERPSAVGEEEEEEEEVVVVTT